MESKTLIAASSDVLVIANNRGKSLYESGPATISTKDLSLYLASRNSPFSLSAIHPSTPTFRDLRNGPSPIFLRAMFLSLFHIFSSAPSRMAHVTINQTSASVGIVVFVYPLLSRIDHTTSVSFTFI